MIGIASEGERAVVQVFPLRDGKLIDRYSFHLENVEGQDTTTILEAFVLEYYGSAPSVPPQIVVPRDAGETSALAGFLTERRGSRVEVRAAERGEKRRLQELATQNARLALESEGVAAEQTRLRRVEALEELREALNLESLPLRIECYDVSNIQEESPGRLDGRLPGRAGQEGALPQVRDQGRGGPGRLRGARRGGLTSLRADAATWPRTSTTSRSRPMPNLVLVDGGKGQLSAVLAAMQAYDLPRVAVISLAKRVEEVYVPDRSEPIVLERHSPGLQLLQRDSRRGAPLRARLPPAAARHEGEGVDLRHAPRSRARHAGVRCCATSVRRSASSPPPRRSSRAFPGCPRRQRGRSTRSSTRRAAPSSA